MKTSEQTKNYFIKLLNEKQSYTKIITELKKAIYQKGEYANLLKEGEAVYNENYFKNCLLEGELEFKKVCRIGNQSRYYYFISNLGRVLAVDMTNFPTDKTDLTFSELIIDKNCGFISVKNGYLNEIKNFSVYIKHSKYTDVYKYMEISGWISRENQNISANSHLHHINNNPSDNRVSNLIYLPEIIHNQIPKK